MYVDTPDNLLCPSYYLPHKYIPNILHEDMTDIISWNLLLIPKQIILPEYVPDTLLHPLLFLTH